ncbi:MAG: M23 family metallopeptidase [Anaerolineae bacterium]|jgi:murein DD-endopeptidase MepM/ murein hydrolase activator NlpD|nr:M23 family metallopeptidase [Anaerolineae bacterium]
MMAYRVLLLCLLLCAVPLTTTTTTTTAQEATPLPPPAAPAPVALLQGPGVTVELFFEQLQQGTMGLVRATGDIAEGRVLFLNRQYDFVRLGEAWYAFVVAAIDARPRDYTLSILLRSSAGTDSTFDRAITITSASFLNLNFSLPADRAFLTDPEVERNEFARLDVLIDAIRPERLWSAEGFQMPMQGEIISEFGQYRVLNQNVQTRHTGWDQQAPVGTPVAAMSRGEVVFADRLDIRGNYVLLDHGYGIFSGYAHLSQVNVERGQTIEKGQIIGLTGNTGRSSGPHLHWEIAVNGEWVDGMVFLRTWLPGEGSGSGLGSGS